MPNIQSPTILVHGQPIPGPLGPGESLRYWSGHPSTGDQPNILCVTGRTRRTNAFWFRADGLNDHQRARLSELPCIPDLDRTGNRFALFCVKTADRQHVAETLVEVLSWSDCDIDYAPISDVWALAIYSGRHPTRPSQYAGHHDRSRLVAACAVAMDQAGMAEWEIRSVLKNPKYKISKHIRENGGDRAVDNVMKFVRKCRK